MTAPAAPLNAGALLRLTQAASVQFIRPMWFRLIRVLPWTTYHGWVWLDGYQLDSAGDAVGRRQVFVQHSGLHPVEPSPDVIGPP